MAKNWIQGINMKKGALTQMAKRAGKSLDEYCSSNGLSIKAKKRCSLRKTLMSLSKK